MIKLSVATLGIAISLGVCPVYAQSGTGTHTYVASTSGSDSPNTCLIPTPANACKTLAYALTQTAPGGTITMVEAGDYDPITISKSLALDANPGIEARIVATSGNGLTINVASTDAVSLTNVDLFGAGTGTIGLSIISIPKNMTMFLSRIRGFANGIIINPSIPSGTNFGFFLSDTEVSNSSAGNILTYPSGAGMVTATFDRVRIHHGGYGIKNDATNMSAGGSINNALTDSVVSFSSGSCVNAVSNASGPFATIVLDRTLVADCAGNGIYSTGSSSSIILSASTVSNNNVGLNAPLSGNIVSAGNNFIGFNGSGNTPTVTVGTN
jgi:hypothetical protein